MKNKSRSNDKKLPSEDKSSETSTESSKHVGGQLLVSFVEGTAASRRKEIFSKLGLTEKTKVGSTELYLVEVPNATSLDSMIETLKNFTEIRFSEKNMVMKTYVPLDPTRTTE